MISQVVVRIVAGHIEDHSIGGASGRVVGHVLTRKFRSYITCEKLSGGRI